jgi:hypothetical protein
MTASFADDATSHRGYIRERERLPVPAGLLERVAASAAGNGAVDRLEAEVERRLGDESPFT